MLGPVGAGKSSYFNTINSIFQDRITEQSMVGSSTFSITKVYRQYQVRSQTTGNPFNFRLCDTCGIAVNDRPDLADLNYLLEGNVPNGYKFSTQPINPDIQGFIAEPRLQDKVHCVVYVFAASSIQIIEEDTWVKLKELQNRMNERAIPRVIILTKIDELSETLVGDVSTVYLNKDVQNAVQCVSKKLCVPPGNVFPIKNYESETMLNNSISCLALQALDRMLGYANDFLTNQHDLMQST
ncbi:hypothetical protein ACJMK2_029863 [Sinanodonta woodiana]|uniref:Interferon-induced protein 44-like n=1 Tax=Sinanodonta woodiana TaxID=1069815 RepID=A0ABD3XFI3_SINWO